MTDNNNKNNQTNNYSIQSHLANNIVTHSGPVHLGLYLDPNDYDYEFNFYSEEEFTQDRAFPLQQTTEETQSDVEERENEKEKEVNENEDAMESLEAVEKVNNQVETANKQAPLPFLQKTTNFEQDNEGRPPQETPDKRCRLENDDHSSHPHLRKQHVTLDATLGATGFVTGNGNPIAYRGITSRGKDTIAGALTGNPKTPTAYLMHPNLKNPYRFPKPRSNAQPVVTPQAARATAEEKEKEKERSEENRVTGSNVDKTSTTNEQESAYTNRTPGTPVTPSSYKNSEVAQGINEMEHDNLERDQVEQPPDNVIITKLNPAATLQRTLHHIENPPPFSDAFTSGTHFLPDHQNIKNPYMNQRKEAKENNNYNDKFLPTIFINGRKLHHSPFLDDYSKQPNSSLDLNQDMEALRPLILSQHKAFTQHIKDLGEINLTLTKFIEKRKDSYISLKHNNKIPRSLRLKCTLSTSEAYEKDGDFLRIKEEFDNAVATFIQKGTELMTDWAELNIQKLLKDRCVSIFKKALYILDGIVSFHADLIGTPTWPSVSPQNLTLFLTKLYLSNQYMDISELTHYLEVPNETLHLICAQILTHKTSDNETLNLFHSMSLSDIDMTDERQKNFIFETLIQFDQILKIATIDVWQSYKNKLRQQTAALKLEAKMCAGEAINASAATALAITKATEVAESMNSRNLQHTLRISNLERALKRQEQKTNEVANTLKSKAKNSRELPKNFNGGRMTEPATSKELQTPPQYSHQRAKQQMVDLTEEDEEENTMLTTGETMPKNHIHNRHTKKYNGKKRRTPSIHWREAEVKNFDPDSPATPMPTVASVMTGNSHQNLPPLFPQPPPTTFFAHAPPPTPTTAPNSTHTPNPFVDNRHYPPGIAIALPPQHSSAQSGIGNNRPKQNPFIPQRTSRHNSNGETMGHHPQHSRQQKRKRKPLGV